MANPLTPYLLASLDSVVQFMPDVTFKLHILTPSGANATVLSAIYSRLEAQLKPFLEIQEFDLRIVLHDDIPSELIGTPVEGKGITQEHLGGTVERLFLPKQGEREGTPHGPHTFAMIHASDFYRLLLVYRDGGLWMDTDHIFLQDIWPLVDMIGPFVYCEDQIDAKLEANCTLNNSLFAATPRHPFLLDGLHRVVGLLESKGGVNGVFPIRQRLPDDPPGGAFWKDVGPYLFTFVKQRWIKENNDVWVVTKGYPHRLRLQDIRHRPPGVVFRNTTSFETSITILGRRYFTPTSWNEQTLDLPLSLKYADMYSRAYSTHLWEYTTEKRKLRQHFVEIIRDKPDSVLAYLFRKSCLIICDPDKLTRKPPTLDELIGPHHPPTHSSDVVRKLLYP